MMRACLAIILVYFCYTLGSPLYSKDTCAPDRIDATGIVVYIYDGDTVRLKNGNKLRLIGINAPELYPRPQQGADQAKNELDKLLKQHHYHVKIRFDTEHRDRYGRQLAHLFLHDDTNVTAWLLRQGLGHWVAVGKNLDYIPCYLASEQYARRKHRNLWGKLPKNFVPAEVLNPKSRGFYVVTGELTRAFETDLSVWLELRSGLRLRLDKRYFGNFSRQAYVQKIGSTLMTRGWIYTNHGKPTMKISHPSLIQFEAN